MKEIQKPIIFIAFLIFINFIFDFRIFAQTASPSGTIRKSIQDQVNKELSNIKQGVAKKGFFGSITGKSDATLTLANLKNETRTLVIVADSTIKLANGKDGTIADIKSNDMVLAMGDVDSENKMTVKRLLVLATPPSDKRLVYFGSVTQSTASTFSLETHDKKSYDVKVTAGTKYNDKYKLSDLKTGSKVTVIVLTSTVANKTSSTALRIHLLP